jgi:hypothetical protein
VKKHVSKKEGGHKREKEKRKKKKGDSQKPDIGKIQVPCKVNCRHTR